MGTELLPELLDWLANQLREQSWSLVSDSNDCHLRDLATILNTFADGDDTI